MVCDNMSFRGDFTPVLAKHSASMNLIDLVSIGVDKMQRNFEPLRAQVDFWQSTPISDDEARLAIYRAFVDKNLPVPARLLSHVHRLYFGDERFPSGRIWRLANAFTSAFKQLDPIPQFQATAKVGAFLSAYFGARQS
jgi:hypothetical protein